MNDAELAHTKELAFWMTERVFMNPISAKLLNEDWRKAFPDEVAVAERMKALVEALESEKRICATWRKTAELTGEKLEKAQGMEAYWKTQCRGITDHCEELQARIAELESRTVKLPESFKLAKSSSGLTCYYADEVDAALTAAGIKVEAERCANHQ